MRRGRERRRTRMMGMVVAGHVVRSVLWRRRRVVRVMMGSVVWVMHGGLADHRDRRREGGEGGRRPENRLEGRVMVGGGRS